MRDSERILKKALKELGISEKDKHMNWNLIELYASGATIFLNNKEYKPSKYSLAKYRVGKWLIRIIERLFL